MHKLRTIDVWDTLLRRKGHPDFSKLISARAISLSYCAELAAPFKDHWSIFRERCSIEGELANANGDGEYEVGDVLIKLLSRILARRDQLDLSALAVGLAELELQFELSHTYPDPEFPAFSQTYTAEQTLFLSDFYMSAERIRRLLQHHALDKLVGDGISSCDVGLNKRSGRLFRYVHQQHGVEPHEHIHIGDNLYADVKVPQRLGIQAVHFQPVDEHRKRLERSAFLHNRQALFSHLAEAVWTGAQDEVYKLQGEARSAYLLGVRVAPLLIGFTLHIAERALSDDVERLYFFTREGEFYLRVWQTIFPENRLAGLELPPADLLEVSRIATFCASLQEISTTELMRVWNLYSTQSIFALLKTLGLDANAFAEVCQTYNLNPKEDLVYPWQDGRVQALIQDARFRGLVQAKIDDDRARLLDYLDQHGWRQELPTVGIVDIGWRGTIQDNLAYLRTETHIAGYYLGLQHFLNPQPENCSKTAFGPDANNSSDYLNLLDAVSMIEMLCNSPCGSVTGYARDVDGCITAIRDIDEGENAVHHAFVMHFQKGVLFASQHWANYVDSHVIVSGELRDTAFAIWLELVSKAHQDLAQAYASLSHNEVFGVGGFVKKSTVPSPWQLFQGLFSRKVRHEVILYIRQTQWAAGIWGRKDLGLIHKLLLMAALQLGRYYKRLRYWWLYRKTQKRSQGA
ncbi:MAG: HAD family hydrolase [Burkholderiales bacterium]|jgi:FMN phosphatase YigB (HAD superfamily)|nr:HAD family hydrolase [Burkholderiales bacterium]